MRKQVSASHKVLKAIMSHKPAYTRALCRCEWDAFQLQRESLVQNKDCQEYG